MGAFNPGVVHDDYGVAHSGDEVDEEIIPVSLGQPYWIANLALKSVFSKLSQGRGHMFRGQEEIKILGVTTDASMLLQSECAGNSIRHSVFLQDL